MTAAISRLTGTFDIEALDPVISALDRIGHQHACTIQAVDARYVAGAEHIATAVEHAMQASRRNEAIARDRGVEILLYLAATRQIERAFEIGLTVGQTPAAVIIVSHDSDSTPEAAVDAVSELSTFTPGEVALGSPERLKRWFDIDHPELTATEASLEALVCERVALLAVDR